MTNNQIIELSAKALIATGFQLEKKDCGEYRYLSRRWNPLENDEQAMLLISLLKIEIKWKTIGDDMVLGVKSSFHSEHGLCAIFNDSPDDKIRVLRRSIAYVAALTGESL